PAREVAVQAGGVRLKDEAMVAHAASPAARHAGIRRPGRGPAGSYAPGSRTGCGRAAWGTRAGARRTPPAWPAAAGHRRRCWPPTTTGPAVRTGPAAGSPAP